MSKKNVCWLGVGLVAVMLAACQSVVTVPEEAKKIEAPKSQKTNQNWLGIDVPQAWGGQLACEVKQNSVQGRGPISSACHLIAVEHETSKLVLHGLDPKRVTALLDKQNLAYHPDSAAWVNHHTVVAAVEDSQSLDFFQVQDEKLIRQEQVALGMAPRDVVVVPAPELGADGYRLIATPYQGKEVVRVELDLQRKNQAKVSRDTWCDSPWHPVWASDVLGGQQGYLAACLDDRKVVFAPYTKDGKPREPIMLHAFEDGRLRVVPRQVRVSPDGRWAYVALELGGQNMRINLRDGSKQWLAAPGLGAASVLPLTDDVIVWGDDSQLYLQKLDMTGNVLETRWLETEGFSTNMQLIDADQDGVMDLVVFNSAALPGKKGVEIFYGPIWERAERRDPKQ